MCKARAGRLLGRAHAARGEHALACAALEAALQTAKCGALLYSEALVVRQAALLGKAAQAHAMTDGRDGSGSMQNWAEQTGRLTEVMGRMRGDKQLLEKLLLHGM